MKNGTKPWLSVILPVYQGEAYLDAALRSLADQKDPSCMEVIVVDDGSTDRTPAILNAWQDRLPLHIRTREHGGNWVASTNEGMRHARGTWISLLHQDDTWEPTRLTALQALADAYPKDGFFLHPAYFIDTAGRRIGRWRCPLPANRPLSPADVLPRLAVQNFIPIVSPMFRRSLAEAAGPMDEVLWYFADWDYWLRLAARTTVVYTPDVLASFRIHPDSQTARRTKDANDVGRQFDTVQERLWNDPAFPQSHRDSARRMAAFSRAFYLGLLVGWHGGQPPPLRDMVRTGLRIGPAGWIRYARDARLWDRAVPRIRLRMARRTAQRT